MDTAKFCGNCGTPFPRSPVPSSSLVNCAQGHIYSAVYEHCPYCPQPDQSRTGDFSTRIESTETVIETGGFSTTPPTMPPNEFETRLDADFATRIESDLQMRIESTETVVEMAAPKVVDPRSLEETTMMPSPELQPAPPPPAEAKSPRVEPAPPRPTGDITPPAPKTPPRSTKQPPKAEQSAAPPAPPKPPAPQPATPPPAPPAREKQTGDTGDRRTLVMQAMTDDEPAKGRGKLIGWLISYTKDQNGIDYRLYAGFNRIGAHPACDIVIEDETVSGSHALIVYRDGRCMIKDELSRNGTYLNGAEVTEARPLENYDQVRVGNTILTFVSAERPS